MRLTVEEPLMKAMLAAAREAAPLEACGLLGGLNGRATEFYRLTNAEASGEHYSMLPGEQFAAVKDMREKGVKMLSIWHSHPATPARMSDEDLRLAYTPDVVYLIVSLAAPDAPGLRGFVVEPHRVIEAEVRIVPPRVPDREPPTALAENEST